MLFPKRKKNSAAIITIGNEILLGKTINTNLAFIAKNLAFLGIDLIESKTVKDDKIAITSALKNLWERFDIVITTGGLGPTVDDITKRTIADFFEKELEFKEELWENVKHRFAKRKIEIPKINENQALLPQDFVALKNDFGTAAGLFYQENKKMFFSLPGVPIEMKNIFTEEIIPILKNNYNLKAISQTTIHTFDITESKLAEKLTDFQTGDINLAFLPQTGRVDLRLYGSDFAEIARCKSKLQTLLSDYIIGFDKNSISEIFHEFMLKNNLTISAAESCTGGLLQKMLTDNSGSSKYFWGGVVSYSNDIKNRILNVRKSSLDNFGAVSKEVAEEMVAGLNAKFNTDISVSITGIAGPEGGTEEKPVGTVFVSFFIKGKIFTERYIFSGNREHIRQKTAEKVLVRTMHYIEKEI